jgi:hypothetical protein
VPLQGHTINLLSSFPTGILNSHFALTGLGRRREERRSGERRREKRSGERRREEKRSGERRREEIRGEKKWRDERRRGGRRSVEKGE